MNCKISIYFDKRYPLGESQNIYAVKLRVYSYLTKKVKLYTTNVNVSISDFNKIYDPTINLRGKLLETKNYLLKFEQRAHEAANELTTFTFEAFEKKLFRRKNAATSVAHHYIEKINILLSNSQIATASNYELSLKSLGTFLLDKVIFNSLEEKEQEISKAIKNLTFYEINATWLTKYESFMVKKHHKSFTTVSMYLRCLRTIFNDAISEGDIKEDIYPFGRGKTKYQIPSSQKTKKSLKVQQLALLFNAKPETPEQEKAKDFWFLSYALYGMNFKDILLLTYENLKNDTIYYYREKTIHTKKSNLKEINVPLNDFAKKIIKKYGSKKRTNSDLLFTIVDKKDNAFEQKRKIKNFITFVNLHFNKLAANNGFDFKITTYWARHSFATVSIQKGASMEFISEALNHSNMNVTKNYFSGFDDQTKKDFSNNLMNF